MKFIGLFIVVVMGIVLFVGCATVPITPTNIENSHTYSATFNKVWEALVASVTERALPVKSIEKDSGILTTDWVIFTGGFSADKKIKEYAVRPTILLGTWEKGRYNLNIFVKNLKENSTKITITSYIQAYEGNVTDSWHQCNSKGVIERQLFDLIESKLQTN